MGSGGARTKLSYRLDLTDLSSNGPLSTTNCITCIQYWTPDILTFFFPPHTLPPFLCFRRILRYHPLHVSAYSVPTEVPTLCQLPRLPGGEAPADTMEGRALQGNTTTRGTLDCYYRTPSRSSSLHNIPCRSISLAFALGNLCNVRLQRHPHTLKTYLATTQAKSSRARCQRSGPAPTLRDLARRPIRFSQAEEPAYRRATPAPPYLDGEH